MKPLLLLLLLTLPAQLYTLKRSASTNDLFALELSIIQIEQIRSIMAKINLPKDKLILNPTIVFKSIANQLENLSSHYKNQNLFYIHFIQAFIS